MEILQLLGLGLVATVIIVFLKQYNSGTSAILISAVVGLFIFIAMLDQIGYVILVIQELAQRANVNQFYLGIMLKIIGIAYIAEFGAQVCKDAGESSIAGRIEFAAKVIVMVLAMPIIAAVLETIIRLLP
ncbi:stage III sporulation protein AD [Zhaonella formicivorans]|uniref:stage III sporulation protein AD n=1 Tax=Zhaonella formicivorans TaxID=2528593 RepID=UPI0010E18385|nr:stage III sporulation protein AD [Zhaonella formicivorans]